MGSTIVVHGLPAGASGAASPWRRAVARSVAGAPVTDGVVLAFTLPPTRWVDLDTLAEATLAGLRDAGVCSRGFAGLHAVLATRRDGQSPGAVIRPAGAAALRRRRVPGPVELVVTGERAPRPGRRDDKRAWRDHVAQAWGGRAALDGSAWADLELRVDGSLLGPLEPTLDALEPVLGRDPRGRPWQEFFPNDHRIHWLRVRRCPALPVALRLRLGRLTLGHAMDSGGAEAPSARPRAHDHG